MFIFIKEKGDGDVSYPWVKNKDDCYVQPEEKKKNREMFID